MCKEINVVTGVTSVTTVLLHPYVHMNALRLECTLVLNPVQQLVTVVTLVTTLKLLGFRCHQFKSASGDNW